LIITARTRPEAFDEHEWSLLDSKRFFVAWKGAVYGYGRRMGAPTIATLLSRLTNESFGSLRGTLHGGFLICVFDRDSSSWAIAVDNAGLYQAFYNDSSVSTSLLQLARETGRRATSISSRGVADFLTNMGVHWNETLIEGIRTIARNEVIELRSIPNEAIVVSKDEVGDLETIEPGDFLEHMAELAVAIEGVPTSVDLSGGFDTRLIACLLDDSGAEFETSVSGRKDLPDVIIGQRAAAILGHPSFVTEHDISSIEDDLDDLFFARDGNGDVLEYHRASQMQAQRRARGVRLGVSGAGGEIFKDFMWLQDFPRYRSRKTNFDRLYDLRMSPTKLPPDLLIGEAAAASSRLRSETLIRFEVFRASTNTESYDRAFYFYRMSAEAGRWLTNHVDNYFPVLAPYLDYDMFRFGSALPRRKRAFNGYHRELLTARCPSLAALKTDIGVTALSGAKPLLGSAIGHVSNLTKKAVDKMGQRTRGRTFFLVSADHPELFARVKNTVAFSECVGALKDFGYVNPAHAAKDVPDLLVGRMLTLGMLVRFLEGGLSDSRVRANA
jgi:asparagine synthetase B (glutamine-hydrolysing)